MHLISDASSNGLFKNPTCPFRKFDPSGFATRPRIIASSSSMLAILHLLMMFVADTFKSRRRLEAENLFLHHQLNIALRQAASSAAVRQ
jgi:hypothetical protein